MQPESDDDTKIALPKLLKGMVKLYSTNNS